MTHRKVIWPEDPDEPGRVANWYVGGEPQYDEQMRSSKEYFELHGCYPPAADEVAPMQLHEVKPSLSGAWYHTTKLENLSSILADGLVPGKGSPVLSSPEIPFQRRRIYLNEYPGDTEYTIDQIGSEYVDDELVVLEVQIPKGVRLYRDAPSLDPIPTVFVKKRIPPEYIRVYETLEDMGTWYPMRNDPSYDRRAKAFRD